MKIHTVGDLKEAIKNLSDDDAVVVCIDDDIILTAEMEVWPNVQMGDGSVINEIRFCPDYGE